VDHALTLSDMVAQTANPEVEVDPLRPPTGRWVRPDVKIASHAASVGGIAVTW
jgi:hypothetical protein